MSRDRGLLKGCSTTPRVAGPSMLLLAVFAPALILALPSCGKTPSGDASSSAAGNDTVDAGGGSSGDAAVALGGQAGESEIAPPADVLPEGYTRATLGGFQRGAAVPDGFEGTTEPDTGAGGAPDAPGSVPCKAILTGIVRDFKGANEPGGHPDFEAFAGIDPSLGIVKSQLGSDGKPVYATDGPFIDESVDGDNANGQQTTGPDNFLQWYHSVPGVNKPYFVHLYSEPNGAMRTFQSNAFFPLDDAGWGNTPDQIHNYGFTTEVHVRFIYQRGGIFSLTGDDDLWVFVNHELAIDLGGLHAPTTKSVLLDDNKEELGIEVGKIYDLDLFHAERHTSQSNFQMDTNLEFTECGIIVPDSQR